MKKILLFIFMFISLTAITNAEENKLYIFEDKGKIYYEPSLIEEDYFIKHLDMVPGRKYLDILTIENKTKSAYTVYMKVVPIRRSDLEEELINNILMTIYLDDAVIYEGKIKGLDYTNSGINLEEAVMLGDFGKEDTKTLKVETKLANYYSNTNNRSSINVEWKFFVQENENTDVIEVIDAPNTLNNKPVYIPVTALILIIIGIVIVLYTEFKEEKSK